MGTNTNYCINYWTIYGIYAKIWLWSFCPISSVISIVWHKKLKNYGFWGKLWCEKQNTLKTPWASKKRPLGQSQLKKNPTARIPQASSLCNALCMLRFLKFPPCILSFRTYFGNIKRRFYVTSIQCLIYFSTKRLIKFCVKTFWASCYFAFCGLKIIKKLIIIISIMMMKTITMLAMLMMLRCFKSTGGI